MTSTDKSFQKFLWLWFGELISITGSGLTSFGLGVYVLQQTGKASAMALVTLMAFLPALLLNPVAGVLADRYDRRLLMIAGDSFSALGLLFILACMMGGEVQLWQICLGIFVSSVFSSLLEPSYKATVTDLLSEDQYARASGLIQAAGSSKFLVSPLLAGFLLSIADIRLLLVIDISTFFVTVTATLFVRRGLTSIVSKKESSIILDLKEGFKAISGNKGILILVLAGSLLTFFLGVIQTLFTPMILGFASEKTLGICETLSASGMLFTSLVIGTVSIKKGYAKILSVSLFFCGVFMALFGLRENIGLICVAGFLFFSMLPFANTSIEVLIRANVENHIQGRAWGMIGLLSQLGYVAAYGVVGILTDTVFTPMLLKDGMLAASVGQVIGTGAGRGAAFLIILAGICLCMTSAALYGVPSVRRLERAYVLEHD